MCSETHPRGVLGSVDDLSQSDPEPDLTLVESVIGGEGFDIGHGNQHAAATPRWEAQARIARGRGG